MYLGRSLFTEKGYFRILSNFLYPDEYASHKDAAPYDVESIPCADGRRIKF